MSRAALAVMVALVLAFVGGWKAAGWQRDSIDLAIQRTAAATGRQLQDVASKSGRVLEEKLEALRNAPPREIRTELVKPDGNTPVYSAVPLPVPMAGNDSGMFQFPPEGTLVEVGFTGGRADKPFVRQTVPDGTSLPDVKPGEQLQQQREEVSQRVTQAGDWVRKTDQTISETSMSREVTADRERRELVSRETTVKATDKTTVLGTVSLLAGAVQHVATGDYAIAASGKFLARVEGDAEAEIDGHQKTHAKGGIETQTDGGLTEKIAQLRKSVAAGGQQIMGPTVHIGSESVNTLQMMLDTIDLLAQLASQCASHSHPGTGGPTTAAAFSQTAAQATQTRSRYENIIA